MRKLLLGLAATALVAAPLVAVAPANATYPPPCAAPVWHNYTGNFDKTGVDANLDGIPDLSDPNWHALPATPGGQHDFAVRGNAPYQTGAPGNGDWFYWSGGCPG